MSKDKVNNLVKIDTRKVYLAFGESDTQKLIEVLKSENVGMKYIGLVCNDDRLSGKQKKRLLYLLLSPKRRWRKAVAKHLRNEIPKF